jgi:sec-independent protein translocase protein TatB
MFDFSMSEIAVIGIVALVVIGPKELPKVLRTAGVWVRKARAVSREFQSSLEQMMREAELEDVRKEMEKASALNVAKEIEKAVDPTGSLAEALKPPDLPGYGATIHDPASLPAAPAEPVAAAGQGAEPAPLPVPSETPAPPAVDAQPSAVAEAVPAVEPGPSHPAASEHRR